jgi:hypothetical protein
MRTGQRPETYARGRNRFVGQMTHPAATMGSMDDVSMIAPGSVVVIRDEEWLVRATEMTADGLLVTAQGRSELVRVTTIAHPAQVTSGRLKDCQDGSVHTHDRDKHRDEADNDRQSDHPTHPGTRGLIRSVSAPTISALSTRRRN